MQTIQLLGSALGLAFVAGLNLYATVLTVGLSVRFGLIELPEHLQGLEVLSNPYILGVAGFMFLVEFLADKIPWVDSLWDSIHTFIRPFGAALIGLAAISNVNPILEIVAVLALAGVGLSSHSVKAGTRLIANQSPEPFTNGGLSVTEDVVVVAGSWFALSYPTATLVLVSAFVLLALVFSGRIFRLLRLEAHAFAGMFKRYILRKQKPNFRAIVEGLPSGYLKHFVESGVRKDTLMCVPGFTGKGCKVGRNYPGYLCTDNDAIYFLVKKKFRIRKHVLDSGNVTEISIRKKLLLDRLELAHENSLQCFHFSKEHSRGLKEIAERFIDRSEARQPLETS